jgi:hypothetical protein
MHKILFNDVKLILPSLVFIAFGAFISFCFLISDFSGLIKFYSTLIIIFCSSIPYIIQLIIYKKVSIDNNKIYISNKFTNLKIYSLNEIKNIEIFGFYGLPIYRNWHGRGRYNPHVAASGYVTIGNEAIVKNKFMKILIYDTSNNIVFSYYVKNEITKIDYIYKILHGNINREYGWKIDIKFNENFNEIIDVNHYETMSEANKIWMEIKYL